MATFDVAKVDTPGRMDAESMEVLGYVMITLDLIVLVGAFIAVAVMFVFFKMKFATVGNDSVRVQPEQQPMKAKQPSRRKLTQGLTLHQIRKAVDHDKIVKFEMLHEREHMKSLAAITARKKVAQARVRMRLIERRRKRGRKRGGNLKSQSWKTAPELHFLKSVDNDDATVSGEVENIRVSIFRKVKTMEKLNRLFAKLDVNHNGMMSKKEFVTLVEAALKKKVKEAVVDLVWNAVWEERNHGENDEMDASTIGHWLKLD